MNFEQNKKDRDKDKILHTLQDMFIDVLDLDVIQNVAHNCDFDLHGAIEALMMLAEGASPKSSPPVAQVTDHLWHPMTEGAACAQLFSMHVVESPLRSLDEKPTQETAKAKDPPTVTIYNQQSTAESCLSSGSIKISYRGQNGCSSSDDDADVFIEDEQECEVLNPTAEEVTTFSMFGSSFSPQFITPILPAKPPSKPLDQTQQKLSMKLIKPPDISPPVPSMATAASKLKDIKVQPSVSKARKKAEHVQTTQLKIMQQLSPIERIQKMVLDGVSLMVIMRGVPGSGKSHLAQHLVLTTLGRNVDFSHYVYSTDDFFALMNNQFNPAFLQHAHEWNRRRVQQAVAKKVSPIIVDNTNTQVWEMQPYAEMAVRSGYALELLEPNTAWRYHEAELFKRNLHGVPRPQIRAMLDRFEHNLTSKKLLDILGLKYSSNNKPNVMGKNAGKSAKPKSAKITHINEEQNASSTSAGKAKRVRTRRRKKKNPASNIQKTNGIPYIDGEQIRLYAEAYAVLSKKSEPADLDSSLVSSKDSVGTSLNMSNQKNPMSKDDLAEDNRCSVSSESGIVGLCLNIDGQSLTDGSSNNECDEDEEEEEKKDFSVSLEENKFQTEELNSQLDELFYSDDDREAQETIVKNIEYNPCTDYMLVLSDSTLLPQKHCEILEEKEECWEYVLVLPDSVLVPQKLHAADITQELNKTEATATAAEIQTQNDHSATDADTNAEIPVDTSLIDLTDTPLEKDEMLQTQMPSYQFVSESCTPVHSPSLIDTPLEDLLVDLSHTISDKESLGPVCELTNDNLPSAVIMPLSPSYDYPNIQLEVNQSNKDIEIQEQKISCAADIASISTRSLSSGELDQWLSSVEERSPEGFPEQELHNTSQDESAVMKENGDTVAEPTANHLLVAAHDSNDEEFLSALSSNDSLTEDKVNQLSDINFNDNLLMKAIPEKALEMKTDENSHAAEEKNESWPQPRKEVGALPLINDVFPTIALEEIPKYDLLSLVKETETKEDSEEQMKNVNKQKILENTNGILLEDLYVRTENTKPELVSTEQVCYTYEKNAIDDDQVIPKYQEQSTTVEEEERLSSDKMTHSFQENNCMAAAASAENYKFVNAEVCVPKQENDTVIEQLNNELLDKTVGEVQQIENETIKLCLKEEMLGKPSDNSGKAIPLHMENEHQIILNRNKSFERDDESVTYSLRHDKLSSPADSTQERNRLLKDSTWEENKEDQLQNWEEIGHGWQDQEIAEQKICVENTADLPKPARERRPFRKADSPYRVLITQTHEPKLENLSISPEMDAWGAVPEPVQSWESSEKFPVLESTTDKRAGLPQPQREIFASEVAVKEHLEKAVLEDTWAKEFEKTNESEPCQTPPAVVPDPESSKQTTDNTSVEHVNLPSSVFNKASALKENDLKPNIRNSEHFEPIEACSTQLNNISVEKWNIAKENNSYSETQQSKYVNENEYLFPVPDLSWKSVTYNTEITRTDKENGHSLQSNFKYEERKSNEVKKVEEELILSTDIGEKPQLTSEEGNIEDDLAIQNSASVPMTNFGVDAVQSSRSAPMTNFDSDSHTISSSLWKLQTYYGLRKEDDTDSASVLVSKHGMTTASTNTLREDFMILEQVERLGSPAGPMRDISVLHARSRSIDEGPNISSESTPLFTMLHGAQGVRMYDKSSMTSEEDRDFAAAMLASAHEREENFNQLVAIFPAVDKDDLLEIFDRCNGDLNWAADILLESGLEHFQGAASKSPPTHDRESNESAGVAERDFASEQGAAGGLLWWESVPSETASSLIRPSEESSLRDYGPDFNLPPQNRSPNRRMSSSCKSSPSETSQQLKKQLEERVVLNEHCYSERTRRIWNLRHGQRDVEDSMGPSEATDEAAAITNLNTVEQPSDEKQELQRNEPVSPHGREALDKVSDVEDECIEEEEEEEEEDEELVPFTIDAEFASQLQQLFGNAGAVPYDEDTSLDVKLPLSLARQIHSYLVETQQSLMEHQYKEMQKMIREDEELARRLQEKEHETKNSVPDLRVVMDMEMALELYRTDQKQWKDGQGKDDLATKLSKQKLCQMFPNLDQDALLQLFTAHSNSFEDTVNEVVVSVDGLRDTEAVRNVLAPEALAAVERNLIEQARQESLKIVENQTRPLPIVVLREPGELKNHDPQQQAKADAEHYRIEANRHRQLRSECINKAQEAYRKGMKTVATYYSQMASLHRQRIDEANARAASSLVTVHTLSQDSTTLDLHFLHVAEALQVLDLFLDHRIVNLASTNRALEYLFLITGRGLRSAGGRSRIRPAVQMRLKQRGLKWSIVNPGMLKVLIIKNSVLAYSAVSTTL